MRRRTATRVQGGRVRKKNNWARDRGDYFAWHQSEIRLDRKRSGPGFRHVVTVSQLRRFIMLLPDWDEVAVGLDAIVLDRGRDDAYGWYNDRVIGLCAWSNQSGLWHGAHREWLKENHAILSRLGVKTEKAHGKVGLLWTEAQARAFMLLDVLPHELGHHRDLMTTRSKRDAARGEPYAEAYARTVMEAVWPIYGDHFDL